MSINVTKAEAEYDQLRAECASIWADVPLLEQAAVYHAVVSGPDVLIRSVPAPLLRLAVHLLIMSAALETELAKQIGASA